MKNNKYSKKENKPSPMKQESHKPQQPASSSQEKPTHFPSNWPKKKDRW